MSRPANEITRPVDRAALRLALVLLLGRLTKLRAMMVEP